MQLSLPDTPHSLLSQLRASSHGNDWQVSWGMFLELYQEPLQAMAANSYRHHTGNARPSQEFIEDAVANVVVDFFSKSQFRYHPDRGRLRGFLRALILSVCPFVLVPLRFHRRWLAGAVELQRRLPTNTSSALWDNMEERPYIAVSAARNLAPQVYPRTLLPPHGEDAWRNGIFVMRSSEVFFWQREAGQRVREWRCVASSGSGHTPSHPVSDARRGPLRPGTPRKQFPSSPTEVS